jgi:hypothetical protein
VRPASTRTRGVEQAAPVSVRFLGDADLNYTIVQGVRLREPAIHFKSAYEAGLEGLPDDEVLEIGAQEGRVLVSHDKRTMPIHFAARIRRGRGECIRYQSRKRRRTTRVRRIEPQKFRIRERGMLTISEMARACGVSINTAGHWRKKGLIRAHPINDRTQFLFEDPGPNPPKKRNSKRLAQSR